MPIVAHNSLPAFEKLRQDGQTVLTLDRATHQDIRELHIGLLNLMPDSALRVTEQQFIRLVGSCNQIAQLFVHPFSVSGLPRSKNTQAYIDKYYMDFEQIRQLGLDALIITGANVQSPVLDQQIFWEPLNAVFNWALENVASVLCSCLATHALVKQLYDIDRKLLKRKRWGVYNHYVVETKHPMLRDINTRFDVPHSRYNDVTRKQLEAAGVSVLVENSDGEVHMAVSPDQFRVVYLQGHPEYYTSSLLKEYKREVSRFYSNEIEDYPSHPNNYFDIEAVTIAENHQEKVKIAKNRGKSLPTFPEEQIQMYLHNTWRDTGKALFNNWLGLVYQLTNVDRKLAFTPGVNPEDPLGIL
jgi:homoserine O-succinyltransferase